MKDDDAALLRRYRNGEAAAFTQLYERHRLGLFRFLLGLCGDHALAEEVLPRASTFMGNFPIGCLRRARAASMMRLLA